MYRIKRKRKYTSEIWYSAAIYRTRKEAEKMIEKLKRWPYYKIIYSIEKY